MKKCDYLGCKKNATVFGKEKAYCQFHAEELGLVKQTNLVDHFHFPEVPTNLKLGPEKDLNKKD